MQEQPPRQQLELLQRLFRLITLATLFRSQEENSPLSPPQSTSQLLPVRPKDSHSHRQFTHTQVGKDVRRAMKRTHLSGKQRR